MDRQGVSVESRVAGIHPDGGEAENPSNTPGAGPKVDAPLVIHLAVYAPWKIEGRDNADGHRGLGVG